MNIWLLIYTLFSVYRNSAWPYALFIMAYAILTRSISHYFSTTKIINREDFLELMLSEDAEHH